MRRASVFLLALVLGIGLSARVADANCRHHSCVRPTPAPTSTVRPTVAPTGAPTPAPTSYLFDDEFDGTALSSSWEHYYRCCGVVTMDSSLSSVSGGYLRLGVVDRSGTWYGTIVDTKAAFTFTYGYVAARISTPDGVGLWPASWLYSTGTDEIDTMEICANPLGTNGGNDAGLLHTTVHYGAGAAIGNGYRTADLGLSWHVYAVDWRPTYVAFYLDGVQVWRETSALVSSSKALLLDLGLGGSWCGAPTAATPSSATMLVDWIRVSP